MAEFEESTATNPDVLQARISVSLAQKRRLVASWLPPLQKEAGSGSQEQRGEANAHYNGGQIPTQLSHPTLPRLGLDCPVPHSYLATTTLGIRGPCYMSPKQALLNRLKSRNCTQKPLQSRDSAYAQGHGAVRTTGSNKRRKLAGSGESKISNGVSSGSGSDGAEDDGGRSSLGGNSAAGRRRQSRQAQTDVMEHRDATVLEITQEPKGFKQRSYDDEDETNERDRGEDSEGGEGTDGNQHGNGSLTKPIVTSVPSDDISSFPKNKKRKKKQREEFELVKKTE